MKSLKNIYESSNFYKEARIISFVDRLLDAITAKIKQKVNINLCIQKGKSDYEEFSLNQMQIARQILVRFQENFFVYEMMNSLNQSKQPNE